MDVIYSFSEFIIWAANYLWNGPLLVSLLLGGGIYFSFRSKLIPILYFKHSFKLMVKNNPSEIGRAHV